MNARTKFLKVFYKLPPRAKTEIVVGFPDNPMTLAVLSIEVRMNTKLGNEILKRLGFKDGN